MNFGYILSFTNRLLISWRAYSSALIIGQSVTVKVNFLDNDSLLRKPQKLPFLRHRGTTLGILPQTDKLKWGFKNSPV